MKQLIAFDYGASGGRAVLGTYDGKTLSMKELHRFANEPVNINGTLYWDFLRLFHELKQGLIKASLSGARSIDGIGVDTWGVDYGLLDKNGSLISNPVHYRDSRTYGLISELDAKFGARRIYDETGIQLAEFNTLCQLYAQKESKDASYEHAEKLLFMPDLFNYFLTGTMAAELSIVSTSQLYDPGTRTWAYPLLTEVGLNPDLLCGIIPSGTKLGSLKRQILEETGLYNAEVFAVTGHDTASAVVSVPSEDIGSTIYLSSGTWSLMGIESTKAYITDESFRFNLTNESGYAGTFRVLKNIVGLWIYQECRREWIKEEPGLSFDALEEAAAACDKFISFIDPENHMFFEPGNMPEKISEFCKKTGQPVPETKGQMVSAIMVSLAMKYRQVAGQLDQMKGSCHRTINIIGGGCRNVLLSQYTADATGKTVIAGPAEATSAGNLLVQLISAGEISGLREAREVSKRSFGISIYEPKNTEIWDDAFHRYEKICGV